MSKPSNLENESFLESRKGQYTKKGKILGRPVSDVRKIRKATYDMPFMTIPRKVIEAFDLMSLFLNGELYTEPLEVNIMKREIRIRFKSPEEIMKRKS